MKIEQVGFAAFVVAGIAVVTLSTVGCAASDVVATVAKTSFSAVAAASGNRVVWMEEDFGWSLATPSGDRILIASDFGQNSVNGGMADMDKPDAELVFDAAPFLAAGLDITKLPLTDGIKYEIEDGTFMIHFELGAERFSADAKKSLAGTFSELVRTQRERIGYHQALDHYGIKLGNGNMFEWAKDMSKNDKDIVFVLNPEPFISAGIDPSRIEGWIFAKVEVMDDAGKKSQVDKLLKPFNLK